MQEIIAYQHKEQHIETLLIGLRKEGEKSGKEQWQQTMVRIHLP